MMPVDCVIASYVFHDNFDDIDGDSNSITYQAIGGAVCSCVMGDFIYEDHINKIP